MNTEALVETLRRAWAVRSREDGKRRTAAAAHPGVRTRAAPDGVGAGGARGRSGRTVGLVGLVGLCVERLEAELAGWEGAVLPGRRLRSVLDLAEDPAQRLPAPSAESLNWEKMQRTLDQLQTSGERRSLDQKRFHNAMMVSCAELVLGGENFQRERGALLEQLGRQSFPFGTLILCPRRWGKSTSVAMFCAAMLYLCPRIRVLILATQRKAASLLMKASLHYFTQLPGGAERIAENNSMRFLVRSSDFTGTRTEALRTGAVSGVTACAPTENSIRGESASLVLIDEAAFVPTSVISVLAPLLMVERTALICILTPDGVDNWYSRLFQRPAMEAGGGEHGSPPADPVGDMFLRFHVDLLCNECREAGVQPRNCKHNAHLLPAWLNSTGQQRAEAFMKSDSHYAQELMGSIVSAGGGLLGRGSIARLLAPVLNPELELERVLGQQAQAGAYAPEATLQRLAAAREAAVAALGPAGEAFESQQQALVYVFIDPAGGGGSETGAVALTAHPQAVGHWLLVGICSLAAAEPGGLDGGMTSFMRQLQEHPGLRDAHFCVGVESNFGGQHFVRLLLERYATPHLGAWSEWRDPAALAHPEQQQGAQHGLCTTRQCQVVGAYLLREQLRRNNLALARGLAWAGRPSRLDMLRLLESQLQQLSEVRGGITGKGPGGQNDDLAMSLLLALYWIQVGSV